MLMTAAVTAVGLGLLAWLLTDQPLLIAASVVAGLFAPEVLLRRKAAKRMALIDDQVSGVCLQLAQAVNAGAPLETALREVAQTTSAPMGEELREVLREAGAGATGIEAALAEMPSRLPGAPSIRMLVASLQLSLELGADIGPQLERLSEMLRQKRVSTARIRSALATAQMQTKLLSIAPIAAYVWVRFGEPQALAQFSGVGGQLRLLMYAGWAAFGYFVSQRILASTFSGLM